MKQIIKFPKEKIKTLNEIYEAFDARDFKKITTYKDILLTSVDEFADTDAFDLLVEAFFELHGFEEIITIGDELFKQAYESIEVLFHMLASFLALNELYQAKTIIRRSKILNMPEAKEVMAKENANFSKILALSRSYFLDMAPCLLLANLINGLIEEEAKGVEINMKMILMRYFDMINMIYEFGYDDEVIDKIEMVARIIFGIEV